MRHSLIAMLAVALIGPGCDDSGAGEVAGDEVVQSGHARLKRKAGVVYGRDLSQALGLQREDLCKELGRFDCVDDAHRIVLGGVEPYRLGIRDPLPTASVTSPIALDRVALSACSKRVARDVEDPDAAVLFIDPPKSAAGAEWLDAYGARLIERILRRRAQPEELEALTDLYQELTQERGALHEFATLACFTVATSLEAVFY